MNEFYDFTIYDIPESNVGNIYGDKIIENPNITILMIKDEYTEQMAEFLSKIIGSIGYDLDSDCQIRTFNKNEIINLAEIHNIDNSKNIFSFGINKNQFQIQADAKSQQWIYFNTFSLLISRDLSELNKNVNLKREFWFELKKQFNA